MFFDGWLVVHGWWLLGVWLVLMVARVQFHWVCCMAGSCLGGLVGACCYVGELGRQCCCCCCCYNFRGLGCQCCCFCCCCCCCLLLLLLLLLLLFVVVGTLAYFVVVGMLAYFVVFYPVYVFMYLRACFKGLGI